jgi:hypothetical protein
MKTVRVRRISLMLVGLLVVLGLVAVTSGLPKSQAGDAAPASQVKLTLSRPAFISNAKAAPADFDIGAYLDQEAGISAWLSSASPINLTNAATAFRVIEDQTSDYIIGSVDLPNYLLTKQSKVVQLSYGKTKIRTEPTTGQGTPVGLHPGQGWQYPHSPASRADVWAWLFRPGDPGDHGQ